LGNEFEGLGVKRIREFNVAILGKWYLRIMVDKGGLWYKMFRARYG